MKVRWLRKKMWIVLAALIVIVAIVWIGYSQLETGYFATRNCLEYNEIARFEMVDKKSSGPGKVKIFISNKASLEEHEIEIEVPVPNHYHPIELHRCGIYTSKSVNYDYSLRKAKPGYDFSLWKYDYNGGEKGILQIASLDSGGSPNILYSSDFRVSPNEKYLVLEEGYLGDEKYSVVIKSLINFKTNNLKDVLIIPFKDLTKSNSEIYGSIGFNEWSKDSRYFWGNIFDGANVKAFYRVDMNDLAYEVYIAPKGTLGGNKINVENGYLTYSPNSIWTGDSELSEEIERQQQARGIKRELHLYHLPSARDKTLAVIDDLSWNFHPKWVSDTELEYQLPGNVIKKFSIDQ